jgi:hypothetical protein
MEFVHYSQVWRHWTGCGCLHSTTPCTHHTVINSYSVHCRVTVMSQFTEMHAADWRNSVTVSVFIVRYWNSHHNMWGVLLSRGSLWNSFGQDGHCNTDKSHSLPVIVCSSSWALPYLMYKVIEQWELAQILDSSRAFIWWFSFDTHWLWNESPNGQCFP